ncbi:MAG TPA: fused MFS/spermidine synthase, partial [Planctomycetota bacterium]|nr:fused MFS/spermidine synthase [Planctomycetota bacterium]
ALVAAGALVLVAALPSAGSSGWKLLLGQRDVLDVRRNFYGVLLITDVDADQPAMRRTTMTHGTTLHGVQFQDAARRREATSYYGPGSGVDVALRSARRRADRPLRVGVVGMGAGTIASYAEAGDAVAYYEINPAVVDLGLRYFSFCSDASQRGAEVDVTLGDARLVLQGQLDAGQPQAFDVLVVDAFSSDAIPVHLLTDECFALYEQHLAPGGILAFHVSNLYLDLAPVVRRLAQQHGQQALRVLARGDAARATADTEWVLVCEPDVLRADPALAPAATPWPAHATQAPLWTDDFSSLWPVLR